MMGFGDDVADEVEEEEEEDFIRASKVASAQSIPDFIAAWEPLTLGTFKNPAVSPIRAPPGKINLGRD